MTKMEFHAEKMEKQLKEWGAKLDELAEKAKDVGAEAKVEYKKSIEELSEKYKTAQIRFKELKSEGGDKLKELKGGIEHVWSDIEKAFRNIKL